MEALKRHSGEQREVAWELGETLGKGLSGEVRLATMKGDPKGAKVFI